MRLLRSYNAFTASMRPIIRSDGWARVGACGSHLQTKTPVPGLDPCGRVRFAPTDQNTRTWVYGIGIAAQGQPLRR
jgi:hypothetical protein